MQAQVVLDASLVNVASRIVDGEAVLIAHQGRALRRALREHRVALGELEAAVRASELESLADVELAALEPGGEITIVARV